MRTIGNAVDAKEKKQNVFNVINNDAKQLRFFMRMHSSYGFTTQTNKSIQRHEKKTLQLLAIFFIHSFQSLWCHVHAKCIKSNYFISFSVCASKEKKQRSISVFVHDKAATFSKEGCLQRKKNFIAFFRRTKITFDTVASNTILEFLHMQQTKRSSVYSSWRQFMHSYLNDFLLQLSCTHHMRIICKRNEFFSCVPARFVCFANFSFFLINWDKWCLMIFYRIVICLWIHSLMYVYVISDKVSSACCENFHLIKSHSNRFEYT